ncbi:MAG: hypothetical protein WEC36_03530 [Phycisphaeraceae bacterium]
MLGIVFLGIACLIALAVFRMGVSAGWHWGGALGAALIPIAFTFFLGIIGLLIAGAFLAAIWKATA